MLPLLGSLSVSATHHRVHRGVGGGSGWIVVPGVGADALADQSGDGRG